MFGISGFELVLILLFCFLVFGPDKLPAIARTVGEALGKFRTAQNEMNRVIRSEVVNPGDPEKPFNDPVDAVTRNTEKNEARKTETFTQRKARYDRERANMKRAEEREAAKAAREAEAAGNPIPETPAKEERKRPSIEELYATKSTKAATAAAGSAGGVAATAAGAGVASAGAVAGNAGVDATPAAGSGVIAASDVAVASTSDASAGGVAVASGEAPSQTDSNAPATASGKE